MGTEIVIPVFGLPFLACLVFLIVLATRSEGDRGADVRTLGLGRKRIATGYVGAMFATLLVAAWMMRGQMNYGLESGNYPRDEALDYAIYLLLFYFITAGIFVLFCLTLLGLPALALLRRLRAASIAGFVAGAVLLGALLGYWWDSAMTELASMYGGVALGFALGARLPRLRSPALTTTGSTS